MKPVTLFYSYSHKDEDLRIELDEHLALLHREGLLDSWNDRRILAGDEWNPAIIESLNSARLVLLLVSASFIKSRFCWDIEMTRAVERHDAGDAIVVPIIVRPCDWHSAPFGKLQALPRDGRAVTAWPNRDEAFTDIAKGLRRRVFQPSVIRNADGDAIGATQLEQESYRLREKLRSGVESGAPPDDMAPIRLRLSQIQREIRNGPQLTAGATLSDRFRLIHREGDGGFGTVWRAFDEVASEVVAVKVLHSQYTNSSDRRDRFRRGCEAMQRLGHPNIVRVVYPADEDEGYVYFCMEYVAGGTLENYVLEGTLSNDRFMDIVDQVGAGLEYAHSQGIVHRDVTPSNVLMRPGGVPALGDFDLVRLPDSSGGTRTGGGLGKFIYASPQCLDHAKEVDARSDVFSLAMVTVFGIYGARLPHDALLRRHDFISTHCGRFASVLLRATAADPDDRYDSVSEYCAALNRERAPKRGGTLFKPTDDELQEALINALEALVDAKRRDSQKARFVRAWFDENFSEQGRGSVVSELKQATNRIKEQFHHRDRHVVFVCLDEAAHRSVVRNIPKKKYAELKTVIVFRQTSSGVEATDLFTNGRSGVADFYLRTFSSVSNRMLSPVQ